MAGGNLISYRLSDGPASGSVIYAAEDTIRGHRGTSRSSATTVLDTMYEGPEGIEYRLGRSVGDGNTMAMDAGQFSGANSTAFGANFPNCSRRWVRRRGSPRTSLPPAASPRDGPHGEVVRMVSWSAW